MTTNVMDTLAWLVRAELQGIRYDRPPIAAWEVPLLTLNPGNRGEEYSVDIDAGYEIIREAGGVTARVPDPGRPGEFIKLKSGIFEPCDDWGWKRLLASVRFWVGARRRNGRITIGEARAQAVGLPEKMKNVSASDDDLALALKTAGWRAVPGGGWWEHPDTETPVVNKLLRR